MIELCNVQYVYCHRSRGFPIVFVGFAILVEDNFLPGDRCCCVVVIVGVLFMGGLYWKRHKTFDRRLNGIAK